jgi:hypothetical protein
MECTIGMAIVIDRLAAHVGFSLDDDTSKP